MTKSIGFAALTELNNLTVEMKVKVLIVVYHQNMCQKSFEVFCDFQFYACVNEKRLQIRGLRKLGSCFNCRIISDIFSVILKNKKILFKNLSAYARKACDYYFITRNSNFQLYLYTSIMDYHELLILQ